MKKNSLITSDNKYTEMQYKFYDEQAHLWTIDNRNPVVGSFDAHNAWADYNIYLFKDINTYNKDALDFGCGPGRAIVQFINRFSKIDGTDISETNLENAKKWCEFNFIKNNPVFYKCNGINLENISSEKYDVVYSTICFQHICVHDIRYSLMQEIYRVLKPDGYICIQMGFGNIHPRGIKYFDNYYDSIGTNSYQDVIITDPKDVESDLKQIGFTNFSFDLRPVGPGDAGHEYWIYFRAMK